MREIKIGKNHCGLIDKEDYAKVGEFNWSKTASGYACRNINKPNKTTFLMHRVIMSAKKGQIIDHKNGNKLDNRKSNLRFCSVMENSQNSKVRQNTATGYKGVTESHNQFFSKIQFFKKVVSLGSYESAEKAGFVYNKAAKILFGEFALLNEIKNESKYHRHFIYPKNKLTAKSTIEEKIDYFDKFRMLNSSIKNKQTGLKGVSKYRRKGMFIVKICLNGKKEHIGLFDNKVRAMIAYNRKAIAYFGENAYLNRIKDIKL